MLTTNKNWRDAYLIPAGTPCAGCNVTGRCLARSVDPEAQAKIATALPPSRRVRKGDYLYRTGEEFHSLFAVRQGSVKSVASTPDGTEQILGFHLPGEMIGFAATEATQHTESAVALEDSRICEWPVDALKALCRDQPSIQEEVFKLMGKTIRLDQEKLLLLGSRSAEARIAGFLLDMALRMEERGLSGREFILPMARGDIANYLGLAHETVSRLFGKLVEDQLIEADRRHITIVDRKGVEKLAMDENSTTHRS